MLRAVFEVSRYESFYKVRLVLTNGGLQYSEVHSFLESPTGTPLLMYIQMLFVRRFCFALFINRKKDVRSDASNLS